MCEITHLHVHTDASLIDGLGTVERLLNGAKSKGFDTLAITDHGTLTNVANFVTLSKRIGIKPIAGLEGYLLISNEIFHLTLLADGNVGLNSLIDLNNKSKSSGHKKPVFTIDELVKHKENIVVLTGCPVSPFQSLDWSDAKDLGIRLKSEFGKNFMAELMFVSPEFPTWERTLKLAKDLQIPLVTTNDVHFPFEDDALTHNVLTKLKASFEYDSSNLFLATSAELENRVLQYAPEYIKYAQQGIRNSVKIGQKLVSPVFTNTPKLPHIPDSFDKLKGMCYQNLKNLSLDDVYRDRLDYELSVISEMDFSTYFLILKDITDFARNNNVMVGYGRGSGAGSLILYLLGITEIDPIQYGLDFERFLNPKRLEMPDVDVDFDSEGRGKVIEYASSKWSGYPVATYSTYDHKSLTQELCKYFGIDKATDEAIRENGTNSNEYKKIVADNPLFGKTYDAMLGQIKHIGKHAGGIIITPEKVPFETDTDGNLIAAWTEGSNRTLTDVGIVKFDLLGVSSLSVIKRLKDKLGLHKEPVDNDPVFDLFRTGDTLGIFQFSGSPGIVNFTKEVSPNTFSDLIAINALYRPGALGAGTANHFTEYKKNPRKLHPFIDDILEETYGIICYQEQFMKLYARVTGGDLGDADFARKIIVKSKPDDAKWRESFEKLKENFINGFVANGISETLSKMIWNEIAEHSRYSFNKAHATAYAKIAWVMAWYKYHFPVEFYAELLSIDTDKTKINECLLDIALKGVKINPPNINTSHPYDYVAFNGEIYLPLTSVKFLGHEAAKLITELRPFSGTTDFISKVPKKSVNKRTKYHLLFCGAFDEFDDKELLSDEITGSKQDSLSVMLPDKSKVDLINQYKDTGFFFGQVVSEKRKQSKYGEYKSYVLSPLQTAWSREYELEVGQWYRLKLNDIRKIISFVKM